MYQVAEELDESVFQTLADRGFDAVEVDADIEGEAAHLQRKVSVLAMQKQYWWQRCTEHREARRTAEAEVGRLRELLAMG
jgi:hypothetical protein